MNASSETTCRYFITYTGVKLPLKLVEPISEAALNNRNTFFKAFFDAADRMVLCQKMVYGEVELQHEYEYDDSGALKRALITEGDEEEPRELTF
jgi:hypothetical protein